MLGSSASHAPGPLERLADLPVAGWLFVGPTWMVGLKFAGVIVGLWIVIAILRSVLGGGSERRLAREARRLVAQGHYEQAGDFHVVHGNLQAAIHMFEQAGAWAKAARIADMLGQQTRARQFRERASGGGPADRSPGAVARRPVPASRQPPATSHEPPAAPPAAPSPPADPPPAAQAAPAPTAAEAKARASLRTRVLSRPALAARAAVERATRLPDGGERYEILGELGRGGMAVVYRARDRILGRIVALKFVVVAPDQPADMLELFYREARAAAALNHPAIVTIYDLGAIGGRPFISMELVEGEDLLQLTGRCGPLGIGEAIWVAVQASAPLDFAHARGLVHRDIKPGNLMVSTEGAFKLMDFGLAVLLRRQDRESTVSGTPAYMSPEQLAGVSLDARADVFSLAASLYELLTGRLPFEGFERETPPQSPASLRADLPQGVADAIVAALDIHPARRPASAGELALRLRAAYQESLARS